MDLFNIKKREIFRFLIGGGSAVLVDYILYNILLTRGVFLSESKGLSFICGATVGFIINKFWTFESLSFSKREIGRYVILYSLSAFVNTIANKIVLFATDIGILAFLCATAVSTIMNFLGQKFFVFRRNDE